MVEKSPRNVYTFFRAERGIRTVGGGRRDTTESVMFWAKKISSD